MKVPLEHDTLVDNWDIALQEHDDNAITGLIARGTDSSQAKYHAS